LAAVLGASLLAGLAAIAGPSSAATGTASVITVPGDDPGFYATIRRTEHGIPHILADDFAGIGYGYGYAFAQDNICTIADSYVTVNAERSRYFGPDESYAFRSNGTNPNNLNSDFFYQRIKDSGVIEDLLSKDPPNGPKQDVKDAVHGYVAGYNRYLENTGVDNLPDPNCRGAEWVRPITEEDVYRRFYQLGLLASQGVAIDGIGAAQPPASPISPSSSSSAASDQQTAEQLGEKLPLGGLGSNAVALGKDATDNGKGLMLGNPHFPWDGSERFYEAQLTIPGQANVEGASLFGVPAVLIGHTDNLAWSHTVSTAYRFTPFQETLAAGSPTTYLYDGQPKEMKRETVMVKVKTDSGLEDRTRTLYSTIHGPVFSSLLGVPFPWTSTTAFTMGDANKGNFRYLNHFFETDKAQSTDELYEILKRNQGIPWVNTIAADSAGRAFYADISVTPHVTDEQAQACNTALGVATFQALRLPVLDGSRSACEWGNDADAVQPGTFGPDNMPHLFRDDYVTNSNDSYWLSNPAEPLEGFNKIIGDERTQRALRTRSGLVMVREQLTGGGTFTRQDLQDMVFDNRQYFGELVRNQLADYCDGHPILLTQNLEPVVVSAACPVLRAWDLHDDLDSAGAILFRRFASRVLSFSFQGNNVPVVPPPAVFQNAFDASDPVDTPNGLNTSNPSVGQALAGAVQDLNSSGIPLDGKLRDWQFEKRGDEKIPIHGGPGTLGVFNAINVGFVQGQGYPNVPHGSSFVMTSHFTEGCPDTRTILTYSLSTNPESPYFADQTRMFSDKEWVTERFCEDEIASDPDLQVTELGTRSGGGGSSGLPAAPQTMKLTVKPHKAPTGKRVRFHLEVTSTDPNCISGVKVRFGGKRQMTKSSGKATIRRTFFKAKVRTARASKPGCGTAYDTVSVGG
jgi:acyl-homoserine-lactone acylase